MAKEKHCNEYWWVSIKGGEPELVNVCFTRGQPTYVFWFGNECEDRLDRLNLKLIRRVRAPKVSS